MSMTLAAPVCITVACYKFRLSSTHGKPEFFCCSQIDNDSFECVPMDYSRILNELCQDPNSIRNIWPRNHCRPEYASDCFSIGHFSHLHDLGNIRWSLFST